MELPLNEPLSQSVQERPQAALLQRLGEDRPLLAVELRPPRSDLSHARSIDTWIDMHHAIRRVVKKDTFVFLTDNAVGVQEEENLHHLRTNLADEVPPARLVPFLTCKHSLEYCEMYADRASSNGYQALIVLGGDREVGAPRCVGHAYELREHLRARVPGLALGGWANPHRDVVQQLDYVEAEDFNAEFFLTQVVSHHDLPAVERFVKELEKRQLPIPAVFGVFFYRSAKPKTLEMLSEFLPVPVEGIQRDFAEGLSAEQVCAKTIRALRELGIDKVYVSNFEFRRSARRLGRIQRLLEA